MTPWRSNSRNPVITLLKCSTLMITHCITGRCCRASVSWSMRPSTSSMKSSSYPSGGVLGWGNASRQRLRVRPPGELPRPGGGERQRDLPQPLPGLWHRVSGDSHALWAERPGPAASVSSPRAWSARVTPSSMTRMTSRWAAGALPGERHPELEAGADQRPVLHGLPDLGQRPGAAGVRRSFLMPPGAGSSVP